MEVISILGKNKVIENENKSKSSQSGRLIDDNLGY